MLSILAENIGISKVDCSQYGMDTVETSQPGVYGYVGDHGISDFALANFARMIATTVCASRYFLKYIC
jgi:hypothetical protein